MFKMYKARHTKKKSYKGIVIQIPGLHYTSYYFYYEV